MSARLSVLFWRDVPVRVIAQNGRTRHEAELPRRFPRCIEQAGGRVLQGTSTVGFGWWTEERTCSADLELEVRAELCRLESVYSRHKLNRLAQSSGFDEYQRNRLQLVQTA
jgi:hypothetical protein